MSDPAMTDHAELARLAERCTTGDPWYSGDDLRGRQTFGQFLPQDRAFIAAANPARVLSLLAEIAALRGESAGLRRLRDDLRETTNAYQARYRQAERQRDQAVGLLRPFAEAADNLDERTRDHDDIWEQPAAMSIDAGHLRAARNFLASMEPKT